jgi:hypothetical protein
VSVIPSVVEGSGPSSSRRDAAAASMPHILRMTTDDTSPAARELISRRNREMSLQEKLERLRAITLAANRMALAGLRMRHPDRSEGELLLQLARVRLGDDLVRRVYGDSTPLE